ncbi:hypothetical protein SKAU_G00210360 [Synaphobranchus kaupii]|uniref:Uncharacterized protein n=1 Tax=Synaphobranchus kaupii TaxID=118154 RepID=A0A9Q1F8L4_SYNKA|nr:hypothetical protein SKAU_G00210360 [Synaphobranchus kaupii]
MRRSKSVAEMRTPMDLIIKRHPEKKKQIRKYMEKWNKITTGGQQWPKEGTFDPTCCDEMEAIIKYHKPKDKSDKREGKRIRENEEQVEDNRRKIDLLLQEEDRRRQDEEPWRVENNRRCAMAALEEECEQYSRETECEQLTQEEKESQRQYARKEEKERKGRRSPAAKSSGWGPLTPTPAEREVQVPPEGMDNQEERTRCRSLIQSPNSGPASRCPEQRKKRGGRPSEEGPKESQPLYSEEEAAASTEGCPSDSESGEEEEADSILKSGTRRIVHGKLWVKERPAARARNKTQQ